MTSLQGENVFNHLSYTRYFNFIINLKRSYKYWDPIFNIQRGEHHEHRALYGKLPNWASQFFISSQGILNISTLLSNALLHDITASTNLLPHNVRNLALTSTLIYKTRNMGTNKTPCLNKLYILLTFWETKFQLYNKLLKTIKPGY